MKICDIHTHILPGVDDGAQTMEQSLRMLQNAVASDVECLVVTPHYNHPAAPKTDLQKAFDQLVQASAQIPVKVSLGAEAHVTEELPALLRQGVVPTINGSRYLLTEFPFRWKQSDFLPMLECICNLGYVPVVAHPERYTALWDAPETIYPWLDLGCHIQLTADSIVGKYGSHVQNTAAYFLKNGLACCVASDAQGVDSRNNNLLEVQSYLSLYYSRRCERALLWENPMTIFSNGIF